VALQTHSSPLPEGIGLARSVDDHATIVGPRRR
jgi:hypothetical protein